MEILIPFTPNMSMQIFEMATQTTDPIIALKNKYLISLMAVITLFDSQINAVQITVSIVGIRR